jgi:hypothetical protein
VDEVLARGAVGGGERDEVLLAEAGDETGEDDLIV